MKINHFLLFCFFLNIQAMDTRNEIHFGNLQRVAREFLTFNQNPNVENLGKLKILTQQVSGKCPENYKKSFQIYKDRYFMSHIANDSICFNNQSAQNDIDAVNRWFSQVLSDI
ncbi:MAG: hypothetical protein ACXWL2_05100 [Candidatus Chromulinivorax sp.]